VLDDLLFATNHQAVPAFETPHSAARADVNIVDAVCRELLSAPDVVHVIRVAAIDQNVARLELGEEIGNRLVHDRSGHHEPDGSRPFELPREVRQRTGAQCLLGHQVAHRFWRPVEDRAPMARVQEPAHHCASAISGLCSANPSCSTTSSAFCEPHGSREPARRAPQGSESNLRSGPKQDHISCASTLLGRVKQKLAPRGECSAAHRWPPCD
jgi:hypothetical protein